MKRRQFVAALTATMAHPAAQAFAAAEPDVFTV